jgi:hypothetical protein
MAMRKVTLCLYRGKKCFIRRYLDNGRVRIASSDYQFTRSDTGWDHVDKFESEKTVPKEEVTILTGDESS